MSFSNYEASVVVNQTEMVGVTSANGSYSITEAPLNVAGFGFVDAFLSAAPEGSFTITRKLITADPFADGTFDDRDYFSGAIMYGDKGFGFTKGRLTKYSISCGIDEIPSINTEFRVLGDIGPHIIPTPTGTSPAIELPSQGSLKVSCTPVGSDEIFETNHVSHFSYDKTINLEQVYALPTGSEAMWSQNEEIDLSNTDAIQVDIVDPIEIDFSFSIVINDHDTKKLRDRLLKTEANNVVIDIQNPEDNSTINSFNAPYARLLSESVSASTDGEITAELSFKCYVNKNLYGVSGSLAQRAPVFLPDAS
jgi:hypothetical protein